MGTLVSIHDVTVLRAFLGRAPLRHIYEIGDLDAFFWPHTVWYGWEVDGALRHVALLYLPGGTPVLLAHAHDDDAAQHAAFVAALCDILPRRFYAHVDAATMAALTTQYDGEPHGRYYKMGLTDRARALAVPSGDAVVLPTADTQALERLYATAYPGNWFDPRMVETGCYVGIWQAGELVAAAGVHVVSQREGVAALGNVTVAPALRGHGLAKQVCARLIRHLDGLGIAHIGLNVAAENASALGLYTGLGFSPVAAYHEVMWG